MTLTTLKTMFDEFVEIYKHKPIRSNDGGMLAPHMFSLYRILKEINPETIIESGVWRGQGTWFMREVCPDANIISFDIDYSNLMYRDDSTRYVNTDITQFNWSEFFESHDPETTLLFLDDHVNYSDRMDFLYNQNPFIHVVYEDNYPWDQGDVISPKKILESETCIIDNAGNRREITLPIRLREDFLKQVKTYREMNPLCIAPTTRWGNNWKESYKTPEPIFKDYESLDQWVKDECTNYTWMCYIELNRRQGRNSNE